MLSKEEWKHSDITKRLVKQLNEDLESIKEKWLRGAYTHETVEGTAQLNAEALGKAQAISDILYFIEEQIQEEKK